MRKILLLLLIVLTVSPLAQTQRKFYWDYPNTEITLISRFEVRLDSGMYENVGIPLGTTQSWTVVNNKTYSWNVPPVGNGTHTVSVRACNQVDCSFEPILTFKLVGSPHNLKIQ